MYFAFFPVISVLVMVCVSVASISLALVGFGVANHFRQSFQAKKGVVLMRNTFNAVRKGGKWVVTTLAVASGSVMAAVPADATTAMGDMKTDAVAVATVFLVATIALAAFTFMKRGAK